MLSIIVCSLYVSSYHGTVNSSPGYINSYPKVSITDDGQLTHLNRCM